MIRVPCPICRRLSDCGCERRELLTAALQLGCSDDVYALLRDMPVERLQKALFFVLDLAQHAAKADPGFSFDKVIAVLAITSLERRGLSPEEVNNLVDFARELALSLRAERTPETRH